VTGSPPTPGWALDRRRFLLGAAGAAGAGLLSGCGGGDEPRPLDEPVVTRPDRLEGDLAVAALLVSLENLLVSVYQEALDKREKLEVPPAPLALFEAAQRQHREHADAWNGILTGAGKPGITGVNLTVKSMTSEPGLVRLRDAAGLLALGQELETITAATYFAAITAIDNNAVLKVAASIQPVENEHVAVMAFLLGRTPAPEAFGRTDAGRPLTDSIG
jgi:hypothetical protein